MSSVNLNNIWISLLTIKITPRTTGCWSRRAYSSSSRALEVALLGLSNQGGEAYILIVNKNLNPFRSLNFFRDFSIFFPRKQKVENKKYLQCFGTPSVETPGCFATFALGMADVFMSLIEVFYIDVFKYLHYFFFFFCINFDKLLMNWLAESDIENVLTE